MILLDEYDIMLSENLYKVRQNCIRGLWELRNKIVFAFSATSSPAHERLLNTCIGEPLVLHFKSEYEMVRGASPVVDPAIC